MVTSVPPAMEYDPQELAERLRDQKSDIEKLGFALGLLVSDRAEVDSIVHRVNCLIDDAVACLRACPRPDR